MDPNQNINNNQSPQPTPIINGPLTQPAPAQDLTQPQPLQQPLQTLQQPVTPISPPIQQPIAPVAQAPAVQPQPYGSAPISSNPVVAPQATPYSPNPQQAQQNGGIVIGGGPTGPQAQAFTPPAGSPFTPKKKHLLSPLIGIVAAVFIIGGASAATFYGYVMPNSPKEMLKTAVMRTFSAQQSEFTGTIARNSADGGDQAKITLDGSNSGKYFDYNINVNVSGVSVPAEFRYVNQSLYFKFGNLAPLVTYATNLNSSLTTPAQQIASLLSNKWVAVDSSIIDQSGLNCLMNEEDTVRQSDFTALENMYATNPFMSIASTASSTINGKSVRVYHLVINDNQGAKFINALSSSPEAKKAQSCLKDDGSTSLNPITGNGKTNNLIVAVYKSSKEIAGISTGTDSASVSKYDGSATITLSYNPVTISAPVGAVPFGQIESEIETELSQDNINLSGLNLNSLTTGGTMNIKLTQPGTTLVKATKYTAAKTSAPITTTIPVKMEGLKNLKI